MNITGGDSGPLFGSASATPANADSASNSTGSTPAASNDTAAAILVQKKHLHNNKHRASGKGHTKDIAESDIDPWVYDLVSPNVEEQRLGRTDVAPKVDKYWKDVPS